MIRATKRWRSIAAVLAAALLAMGCAGCSASTIAGTASVAPSASATLDDLARRSDRWLTAATRSIRPGCSAAAAVDGELAWSGARGIADIDANTPLTTTTRFDIGSVANQFTATAILLLAQEGKLALTDQLSAHLTDIPAWAGLVSIEQLLHQTSGVPDIWAVMLHARFTPDQATTQEDAVHALQVAEQLNFDPGRYFEFTDSNYLLLAEVVRAVSGLSLPEYLRERVFDPANLDIGFRSDTRGEVAVGYEEILGELRPASNNWVMLGPGFLLATPSELVRWADNYRTGAVGGPHLLDAIDRDAVPVGSTPESSRYGAGILTRTDGSIEHDGWPPGGRSYFAVSPDRHTAVALSCNQAYGPDRVDRLIVGLRTIWFGTT